MSDWETPPPGPAPEFISEPPPPPPERVPFWNYMDFGFFVALAAPSFLASALLVNLAFWVHSPAAHKKVIGIIAFQFLGYAFWFLCLRALLKIKYDRPFWRSLGWKGPAENWTWSASLGFVLALTVLMLAALLRTPNVEMPLKDLLSDRFSVILIAIFGTTLGPVCEELAFRGFLMPLLMRSLGVVWGILVTALPFALLHGSEYAWSWQHLVLILVAGAAFGWMRYRSGSTAAAALMHATYNLTFFIGLILQTKLGNSIK